MCKVVVKGVDKGWGGVGEPAFFFLEPPPPRVLPCVGKGVLEITTELNL